MLTLFANLFIQNNTNRRSTPVGAKVNGSRFASLITLRVLEPALTRCKNSNKFGFRSLTRSFDFVEAALARCKNSNKFGFRSLTRSFALCSLLCSIPCAFQALPLGKW